MPHDFNKLAFDVGRKSGNNLLALYSVLVVIELGLKDGKQKWPNGHYVQQWLSEFNDAGLSATTYQLANELQKLTCTDRSGGEAPIALDHYPDLRYLRHEMDYPGKSTDGDIAQALALAEAVRVALKGRGILS